MKTNISISHKIETIFFLDRYVPEFFPYKLTIHEKINYKSFHFENKPID